MPACAQRLRRITEGGDERAHQHIVAASPVAMVVVVGGTVVFDPAADRMLGAPRSEVVGTDLFTLVPETVVPGARGPDPACRRLERSGRRCWGTPHRRRWLQLCRIGLQIAPMTYAGQPAVQIVLADHAGERDAAIALKASEERFRTAFFNSPAPIVLLDLDGSVESINPAGKELLGYGPDEVVGTNWQHMVAADQTRRLAEFAEGALKGGGDRFTQRSVCHHHAPTIPALVNVALVRDVDGRGLGFVGQLHDLTERYAVEHALRE